MILWDRQKRRLAGWELLIESDQEYAVQCVLPHQVHDIDQIPFTKIFKARA